MLHRNLHLGSTGPSWWFQSEVKQASLAGKRLTFIQESLLQKCNLSFWDNADLTWQELLVYTVLYRQLCQEIPSVSDPGVQPLLCLPSTDAE